MFGIADLDILAVPQGISNNIDLLAHTLKIDVVNISLSYWNRSVVEVVTKIGVVQLSEWDWWEQY
jgi:hypothetical protein